MLPFFAPASSNTRIGEAVMTGKLYTQTMESCCRRVVGICAISRWVALLQSLRRA
jgi:hypothetical protein